MDDSRVLELIGQIYEAPGDAMAWDRLVARIATTFGSEHGHYAVLDPAGPRIVCDFVTSREAGSTYARDYAARDLAVHRMVRRADRRAVTQFDLMADTEIKDCPVHQEFLPKFDVAHRLWAKSGVGGGMTFISTALRSRRQGAFSPQDYRLLELLHPHAERAMRLHLELMQARGHAGSLEAGLDSVVAGIVLLDGKGTVLFANRAARALLEARDGLAVERGHLAASSLSARPRLDKLIARALGRSGGPATGGGVGIPRAEGRPLVVRALPLRTAIHVLTPGAAAVVLIQDPERPAPVDGTWLAVLGLSPAESRLAAALAAGQSLEDYARAAGLRRETVRSTLKSAFAKTDTHRQAELVALVLRGGS